MYKINYAGAIIRLIDGACIPRDDRNGDYRLYLAWVEGGNMAPVDPPLVPSAADLRQTGAREIVRAIPLWAKWTIADLEAWWTPRLGDAVIDGFAIPVGVKDFLKSLSGACLNIAKLLIAMRDHIWPELPDLPSG